MSEEAISVSNHATIIINVIRYICSLHHYHYHQDIFWMTYYDETKLISFSKSKKSNQPHLLFMEWMADIFCQPAKSNKKKTWMVNRARHECTFISASLTDAVISHYACTALSLALQLSCKSLRSLLSLSRIALCSLCTFKWSFWMMREISLENLFASIALMKVTASFMLFGKKSHEHWWQRCGKYSDLSVNKQNKTLRTKYHVLDERHFTLAASEFQR